MKRSHPDMVGQPIKTRDLEALQSRVRHMRHQRIAHDAGDCYKNCVYHGEHWPHEPKERMSR